MGTNFYWIKDSEDPMDPRVHIGKRSAAGLYCWDCGVTLCKEGVSAIHSSDSNWYEKCPKCGKEPEKEGWGNAVGRELGFAKNSPKKKTGVKSCSSFTWAQKIETIQKRIQDNLTKKVIKDEYDRTYTGKEFLKILEECPIQFKAIGAWFS